MVVTVGGRLMAGWSYVDWNEDANTTATKGKIDNDNKNDNNYETTTTRDTAMASSPAPRIL